MQALVDLVQVDTLIVSLIPAEERFQFSVWDKVDKFAGGEDLQKADQRGRGRLPLPSEDEVSFSDPGHPDRWRLGVYGPVRRGL